ncbi:MAG: hypothetical protein K2X82_08180, partial [Gemmataceae bacterium]|nr:hypothetical protein [Gemmataceae bacterium]
TITLTAQQAKGDGSLAIGAIDDLDLTFVNGHPVGYTFGWGVERTYHVPAKHLKAGENTILIAANNMWDTGGFFAGPDRLANEPRPVRPDVAASPPVAPPAGFARAAIRVPLLVPVADLSREDAREPLLDALRQDSAARVDLFARDTARAIELLQAAAKAAGLTVHADAPTLDRARRRPGATYLLYTDTLTPAEVVDLLAGLADADAAGPTPVFDAAHVTPAGPADAKELKDTLGVDLGSAKRAAGVDPAAGGRPIAAGTSGELSKGITTLRAGDKPAALTPLPPPGTRPAAPPRELRQLLDAGSPRKPAALPLLLVVRPAAG